MRIITSTLLPEPYCPSDSILPPVQGASQTVPCVEDTRELLVSHGYGFILSLSSHCAYITCEWNEHTFNCRCIGPGGMPATNLRTSKYTKSHVPLANNFPFAFFSSARASVNPGHRMMGKSPSFRAVSNLGASIFTTRIDPHGRRWTICSITVHIQVQLACSSLDGFFCTTCESLEICLAQPTAAPTIKRAGPAAA